MSLWNGIDRESFERNLKNLSSKGKPQHGAWLQLPLSPSATKIISLALPAEHERQLADDFAFLASTSDHPRSVAAAAIAHVDDPQRLRLTISANGGVDESTATSFRNLLDLLECRAKGITGSEKTRVDCEKVILTMQRDRILGRIGSIKARGQSLKGIDLHQRISSFLEQLSKGSGVKSSGTAPKLITLLNSLRSSMGRLRHCAPDGLEEVQALRQLIHTAFDLNNLDNKPLIKHIHAIGLHNVQKDSRELRELRALGNYWRLIKFFEKIARKYRNWFGAIELNVLQQPPIRHWGDLTKRIHAEIQILFDFELHPWGQARYLGASKKPCFLCYSFIDAHAMYGVHSSHGEVFEQWTIPDDAALSPAARERCNLALECTSRRIKEALPKSKVRKGKARRVSLYTHALQTTSKLLVDFLTSASPSLRADSVAGSQNLQSKDVTSTADMPVLSKAPSLLIPASDMPGPYEAKDSSVAPSLTENHPAAPPVASDDPKIAASPESIRNVDLATRSSPTGSCISRRTITAQSERSVDDAMADAPRNTSDMSMETIQSVDDGTFEYEGYVCKYGIEIFVESDRHNHAAGTTPSEVVSCRIRPAPDGLPKSVARVDVEDLSRESMFVSKSAEMRNMCFILRNECHEYLIELLM